MNHVRWILLTLCMWLLFLPDSYAKTLKPADFPSLVTSIKIDTPLEFCGEEVPIAFTYPLGSSSGYSLAEAFPPVSSSY